jgi:Zn-dependent peptidase ImmA (M78 family)
MTIMVHIHINPSVLGWAVVDARTSPDHLDDKCGFNPGLVESWISGEIEPNTGELRKVSRALGRSLQFFLLPEPPTSTDQQARFRRSLHDDSPEPEKEVTALRLARRAQKFAYWADESVSARLLVAMPDETAPSYARRLTDVLNWNLGIQRSATSKSAVFRLLRQRVESLGALVMLQPAGKKNFRGFSLAGDPPLIFVNKDYGGAALRSFTLLHEMAHLGKGTGDRSCYYENTGEERWCNQVATEFLLPKKAFKSYIESKGVDHVTERDLDIVRLASNNFKASWLAVTIRLKEIGFAEDSLVEYVRDNFDLERDPSTPITGVDRTTPVIRNEEFGTNYIRYVHKAVSESRLSEIEAGKLLRSNAQQLHSLWQLTSEAG